LLELKKASSKTVSSLYPSLWFSARHWTQLEIDMNRSWRPVTVAVASVALQQCDHIISSPGSGNIARSQGNGDPQSIVTSFHAV
jgi:hypothetical protein